MDAGPQDDRSHESSVDPRVLRTREHIIGVTRELLIEYRGAISFSLVAERGQVARQTLYTHWGTIEALIADTIVLSRTRTSSDYVGLDASDRAELFFTEFMETMKPGIVIAAATIVAALHYDKNAGRAYVRLESALFEIFLECVGPISHDQFIELASPIVFTTISGGVPSPQLLASLAERATQFLR